MNTEVLTILFITLFLTTLSISISLVRDKNSTISRLMIGESILLEDIRNANKEIARIKNENKKLLEENKNESMFRSDYIKLFE